MGRTACKEPQCLYKGALYLYLYLFLSFQKIEFLSLMKANHFTPHRKKGTLCVGKVLNLKF